MIYSNLKINNKPISRLGFGCWALSKSGWKDVNLDSAYATLSMAYQHGITIYDTAPIYGFGKSEEILGTVLKDIRDKIIICTKFGLIWNEKGVVSHNISPDSLMFEIDNSLRRLQTDYIDLYQIHWPDNKTEISLVLKKLAELKNEGIIKNIGISNFSLNLLQQSMDYLKIDAVQYKYNIFEREIESDIIPFCKKNQIILLAYSPLAQGIISGKVKSDYITSKNDIRRFNPLLNDKTVFDKVSSLGKSALKEGLSFVLNDNVVTSALVSMTKENHLIENCKIVSEI